MPSTALAPRSRIPTLKPRSGTLLNRSPQQQAVEEPLNSGSLSKKRGSATLVSTTNPRASPNPKARKILRTEVINEQPKRARASSPAPPSSARKRPRKSNHPPDFDYVPEVEVTPLPRRTTRHSLAAQQQLQEPEEEEDPMDCLTGPGALDTAGDSPPPPSRARSATGFDFTLNGSRLMDGMDEDISSGGLYSDLDENEDEQAETSIARMAGMSEPRVSPPSRPRASAASTRQPSTTPRRGSQQANVSRRQSKSPNISRRTSTATARQKSATPRRQSTTSTSRRQSTTPTPRRRTEPKTLPPPVLTLTSSQARKEARLAAAQAEAEAKLRASAESELGGLSIVGEEEEEEEGEAHTESNQPAGGDDGHEVPEEENQVEPEEQGEREREQVEEHESGRADEGEESDDPLASAPVFQSPTQPSRADTSRVITTPRGQNTLASRSALASVNKSKRITPRRQSATSNHVRWTPRSSGKRSTETGSRNGYEDEEQENDTSTISRRTRASTATSRRSSAANTPRTASGSRNKSAMDQVEEGEEEEEQEAGPTPRGRNTIVSRTASRSRSSTSARSRSASRTASELDSRRQNRGSPVARGRQSTAGSVSQRNTSKSVSRERHSRRSSGNTAVSTTKSPMRVEVVLPAPRRSSVVNQSRRLVVPEEESSRVVQQPTPDPSSLDHSPGLVERLNQLSEGRSSQDPAYQQPSELDPEEPQDEVERTSSQNPTSVLRSQKSISLDQTQRGNSALSSLRQEKSQRRLSGPKKWDLSQPTQADSTGGDQTFRGPLDEFEDDRSLPLDTVTPRVALDSTARAAFDFTPGSELKSGFGRIGSYAQSTPYVRGSFGLFNQGEESSPIQTGPSDLEIDDGLNGPSHSRIPYAAKGKSRDDALQNKTSLESSQQHYRGTSVDSSIVVALSSPDRSLRTERISTPRVTRVSLVGASDDDQDDGPPSPSAGRQSFSESINGRNLSDILRMKKQARDRLGDRSNVSTKGMTTMLNETAQEVLHSAPTRNGRRNNRSDTTDAGLDNNSQHLVVPQIEDASSDVEIEPHFSGDDDERIVRGSVLDDHPLDKHSIHLPYLNELGPDNVQDYNASVHFDAPSRAPIRRSATPVLRNQIAGSDDELGQSSHFDRIKQTRSTSGSDDSSGPEEEPEEQDVDEQESNVDEQPRVIVGSFRARDLLAQASYMEGDQSKMRFAPSPSSSARSTSRSLSRPRERYGSYFAGDRTNGLSRSQMMIEASRFEDWEPPARRKLKPRPWTDHDWRMLAHYLRRVQKSQALAKGMTSREELDLMMVNVHAVVDRFVEEEAHGIKLEGEWARSEITGRAVYLIIKERHKQDGTWKTQALSDPSFSAILADMTRPRAVSEDMEEADDLSGERMLPAALAELPAPSRAAAENLLARTPSEDESDGRVSETPFEDEDEDEDLEEREDVPVQFTEVSREQVLSGSKRSPKRSPKRQNASVIVAHQRTQQLQGARHLFDLTASDYSSVQADETSTSGPSMTVYSRLIGSLSSIIGGRALAETTGASVGFPKLKPVSRTIDLTHLDDDEQPSFPTLNHVPTPARPTPARPKRQKHIEPKLDLPPLQHISPPRPAEPPRVPRKKPMRRVASVRELTQSFEKMGEENRRAAEAARNRVGYGRSVSGPVTSSRVAAPDFARPVAKAPSPKKTRPLKDNVEVIEISDSSIAV